METDREIWALELGARALKEGVRFKVWAPKASRLSLKVPEKYKEIPMDPEGRGYFTAWAEELGPGARYYYLLDGIRPRPDPVSRYQPGGVDGASEVIDPSAFEWQDLLWPGLPLEELLLYEIHTGVFTPEGTFEAIIPHLDYLKDELGITAIELMPVAQFPGRRNWGYDGTYLFAPQNSYGGPFGLKALINACHQKGLGVFLDVVYNHLWPEGNNLGEFVPYFTDRYKTPWGQAVNLDGPESDQVRRFIIDNALYWVTEYHLDGLRIDAVQGIFDFSARHILDELKKAVQQQAGKLGRQVAVIAESDLNDVRIINSPQRGGYGLDAQWNDDFHHSLHALLTRERDGYYRDFGDISHLAKAVRQGFVYSGQFSPYRRRRHGSPSGHLPPAKFVVFSQNHDQVGNRVEGERLSALVSFEALKLAAGLVLLSANIPLLFMGEEYGEKAPFFYFISLSDPVLSAAVRQGREEALPASFDRQAAADPQDRTSFLRSKIHPELRRQGNHKTLFEFYQTLIRLRKETPALSHLKKKGRGIRTWPEKQTLVMFRRYEEEQTACFFNFHEKPQRIQTILGPGIWEKTLDSSSKKWLGPGSVSPDRIQSKGMRIFLEMNAQSLVLYRHPES
ncbi:MAG: malto-oligosyltrehalose trehalohydrolase [Deltaproteobacteria bacterium]|nr:malto-oligosyltrehalose trehalohydrolase [Deltaproteobacteria bacterium]